MRKGILFILSVLALAVVLSGAAVWLANAPLQPAPQSTHRVLPDERIPH
jgi:hypothetical protein